MQAQFKIIGYSNSRDYHFKKNGIVITDIETLLKYVNKTHYFMSNGKEVQPNDDWDYAYSELEQHYESLLNFIDIIEKPTDTKLRVIGISYLYAFPHQTGNVIYDSIIDSKLKDIPQSGMSLYPYTMDEFLYLLTNNRKELRLNAYNYIVILNH